jgi:UDPglucose--hexose-1-phosphate uridylyltransferase
LSTPLARSRHQVPRLPATKRTSQSSHKRDTDDSIREIRINPIVPTESVLVATARGMRPKKAEERIERDTRAPVETCPFCHGNKDRTPPQIKAYPDSADWQIRIVPNLYPVLGDDSSQDNMAFGLQQVIDG